MENEEKPVVKSVHHMKNALRRFLHPTAYPTIQLNKNLKNIRFQKPKTRFVFDGIKVEHVDFSGLKLLGYSQGSTFEYCDFSQANLQNFLFSHTTQSVYRNCTFRGSDIRQGLSGNVRFEACTFDNARIEEWFPGCAEFVNCKFRGSIKKCVFFGKPTGAFADKIKPKRAINEFRDNDFGKSALADIDFRFGISLKSNTWPDDDSYFFLDHLEERIQKAKSAVFAWKDLEQRRLALIHLKIMEDSQQDETILRIGEMPAAYAEVEPKLIKLLTELL